MVYNQFRLAGRVFLRDYQQRNDCNSNCHRNATWVQENIIHFLRITTKRDDVRMCQQFVNRHRTEYGRPRAAIIRR